MMTHGLKERLPAAKRLFGTHIPLSDPEVSAVLSRAGFDFVLLEADNTEANYPRCVTTWLPCGPAGCRRWCGFRSSAKTINRVLETGPHGLFFGVKHRRPGPARCFYVALPPEGTRHFNPLRSVTYKIEERMSG